MPTPSLILVPARFKTGKLYTPVATTSGGVVLGASGDFNVTRATTATRVNANGFIESVASGIPRLDYYTSGGTAGCPALLVEASGSNIMGRSEELSVSGNWGQTNVNVSGGAIASPDGLASGTLIVATASSTTHFISRSAATSVTSGAVITVSCFLKAHGSNNFAQLYLGDVTYSPAGVFANFSLSGNGAVTTGTNTSAFIQNYGNGWYRCGLTTTAAASGTPGVYLAPILASGTSRNAAFLGDAINGVYAWGVQLETNSLATSYIPTTTTFVTRNADAINVTGAVSGCIGQTEGTIYVEAFIPKISSAFVVGISNGLSLSEAVYLQVQSNSNLELIIRSGGSIVNISVAAANWTAGLNKVAFTYGAGSCSLVLNGGSPVTGTVTNVPTCNRLTLGSRLDSPGTLSLTDRIRSAALYTTRLTDLELAALTT